MRRLVAACLALLVGPLGFASLCLACSTRPESTTPAAALPAATGQAGKEVAPARSSPASTPFLDSLTEDERSWLRAHPVIRVVQDPGWPPIEFADERGNPSGMTRDYLDLIERRLGLTFEQVRGLDWQEGYSRLKRWEIDMTTTVAATPEREAFWSFTAPYMTIPIVIATRADVTYVATMHDLSGKQVAVVDGYAVTDWLPRDFPEIRLLRVKTSQEGLELLQRGEVFAFIDSLLTIGYHQSKFKTGNVKIAGNTPYTNSQCMAVRKDWAPLAGILQKALESISEAERNEILRRWMPLRYEQGFDYALFWKVLAPLTLLLLGFVVWNRRLVNEIRQRKSAQAQRGRAEEALSENEAKFRTYVEAAPQALFVVDGKGRYLDFNPAALEMIGVDGPTLRSMTIADLHGEASREGAFRDFEALVATGRVEKEYELLRPDGRSVWVTLRGVRIGDDRFMAFCEDITERKQGEEEIARVRERLALATGAAHMGVWDWDVLKDQLVWDEGMYELYGVRKEGFRGAYEAWIAGLHPEDRARSDADIRTVLSSGGDYTSEFRVVWPDGTVRQVRSHGTVFRDEAGKPLRMIGVNYDITERKRAEAALQQRAEDLRASNAELEKFNRAMVGRELRMIELKREINELCRRLGEPPRHVMDPLPAPPDGSGA